MTERSTRTDPYDLAFGAGAMDDRLFPPIQGEAEARGLPLEDPERFLFLTGVGRLVHAIAGPTAAAGAALRQHGRLLFHAFHHWQAGKVVVELGEAALRRVLDGAAASSRGPGPLTPPAPAGYLRLPRNRVWATATEGDRPEPADGFFWTYLPVPADPDDPGEEPGRPAPTAAPPLHLLLVLGVRADRPGFSVVPATGVQEDERPWATMDARPGGRDFATTLPGGELDRLYSVETPAELLKLAALCFLGMEGAG